MNKELTKRVIAPWLLVVFIIVLLGGGGYLVWFYYGSKSGTTTTTPTPIALTSAKKTSPSPTAISTADWQTYQNDACGYLIKYPNDWQAESYDYRSLTLVVPGKNYNPSGSDYSYRGDIRVQCDIWENKTLDDIITDKSFFYNRKETTFKGLKAYGGTTPNIGGGDIQMIALSHDNHLYRIDYLASSTVTEILSTFQFTK